jgi:hypothetical protein
LERNDFILWEKLQQCLDLQNDQKFHDKAPLDILVLPNVVLDLYKWNVILDVANWISVNISFHNLYYLARSYFLTCFFQNGKQTLLYSCITSLHIHQIFIIIKFHIFSLQITLNFQRIVWIWVNFFLSWIFALWWQKKSNVNWTKGFFGKKYTKVAIFWG